MFANFSGLACINLGVSYNNWLSEETTYSCSQRHYVNLLIFYLTGFCTKSLN
jgi:hypothetical protein